MDIVKTANENHWESHFVSSYPSCLHAHKMQEHPTMQDDGLVETAPFPHTIRGSPLLQIMCKLISKNDCVGDHNIVVL